MSLGQENDLRAREFLRLADAMQCSPRRQIELLLTFIFSHEKMQQLRQPLGLHEGVSVHEYVASLPPTLYDQIIWKSLCLIFDALDASEFDRYLQRELVDPFVRDRFDTAHTVGDPPPVPVPPPAPLPGPSAVDFFQGSLERAQLERTTEIPTEHVSTGRELQAIIRGGGPLFDLFAEIPTGEPGSRLAAFRVRFQDGVQAIVQRVARAEAPPYVEAFVVPAVPELWQNPAPSDSLQPYYEFSCAGRRYRLTIER